VTTDSTRKCTNDSFHSTPGAGGVARSNLRVEHRDAVSGDMCSGRERRTRAVHHRRQLRFHDALAKYTEHVDLIVTTGGISAGTHEVVKSALSHEAVHFTHVAIKPGKPQGIGRYRGTPIVCFPGNPVAAYTSFEVFLRPPLRRAMGYRSTVRPVVRARLRTPITARGQIAQYRLGLYGNGTADPVDTGASHSIRALGAANCLISLPAGVGAAQGDELDVWLLDGPN
jgi:molybdopterin molybdotransferase